MFDKIKMRRGRQWYVNKGNEWFLMKNMIK